jgi:2,3-bisphosphoglycerate-dependent phosphoglycerate mutase
MTTNLILMRHGCSEWNEQGRFSGWQDVDLSAEGERQAHAAARALARAELRVDTAFTSRLTRAIRTLWTVLDELDRPWVPVHRDWRFNETHYGALERMEKAATARREGAAQVERWRQGYSVRPPKMSRADPRWPGDDARYAEVPNGDIPTTESLADTVKRAQDALQQRVYPELRNGRSVLIVAHRNVLRAIASLIEDLSVEEVEALHIDNAVPIVYSLNANLCLLGQRTLPRDQAAGDGASPRR